MAIQAVIFDLDDTLYPERQYVLGGLSAVGEHLRTKLSRHEDFAAWLRAYFEKTQAGWTYRQGFSGGAFDALSEEFGLGLGGSDISELVRLYRCHSPLISLYDDVPALLAALRPRRLGLLSDGFLPAQRLKIQALGIEALFDEIVMTEELGREFWKPSPRGFEIIADKLGLPHEQLCYVADNLAKDFVAPNSLGWLSVRMVRPGQIHAAKAAPPGGTPQHTVKTAAQLLELISSA